MSRRIWGWSSATSTRFPSVAASVAGAAGAAGAAVATGTVLNRAGEGAVAVGAAA